MIISTEKNYFTKFNIQSWQKSQQSWYKVTYLNIKKKKAIYDKPTTNILPNSEKMKTPPPHTPYQEQDKYFHSCHFYYHDIKNHRHTN